MSDSQIAEDNSLLSRLDRGLYRLETWLTSILTFLLTLVLGYGAWLHTERALEIGDSTEDIGMPVWPIKAVIVLMFTLLGARLALQTWGFGRLVLNPSAPPIAVPIVETPEEQADREAKSVSGSKTDTSASA